MNPSSAAFFEAKYEASPDPWNFAEDAYELRRYDLIVQALIDLRAVKGRHYAHCFEPGCSIGVLTQRLAKLCDRVSACEFSPTAAEQARLRCGDLAHVQVSCEPLTAAMPWQNFDLVVLSEIGYYLTPEQWQAVVDSLVRGLRPGAIVLAAHWRGKSADHIQGADEVHSTLHEASLEHLRHEEYPGTTGGFRLDLWRRA